MRRTWTYMPTSKSLAIVLIVGRNFLKSNCQQKTLQIIEEKKCKVGSGERRTIHENIDHPIPPTTTHTGMI